MRSSRTKAIFSSCPRVRSPRFPSILVTQKAASTAPDASGFGRYRDAAFLVKRKAVTVLPTSPQSLAIVGARGPSAEKF
jgi:hypothetical protein